MESSSSSEGDRSMLSKTKPKFKNENDFLHFSTGRWTCRVCMRANIQHRYLMTAEQAIAHEVSAYHRHQVSVDLYQYRRFSDDNSAWEGPDRLNDVYDWLKEQELKSYFEQKAAAWEKLNPDWNAYNPDKDAFLHPEVTFKDNNGRTKQKYQKRPKKNTGVCGPNFGKQNKPKDSGDADSIRAMKKGLGHFTYDTIPKPKRDMDSWLSTIQKAQPADQNYSPEADWNTVPVVSVESRKVTPLDPKITDSLFQFGKKYASFARLDGQKKEEMHLFLELPSSEKISRIELLAMRLCDPSRWPLIVDETRYWN